MKYNTNNFLTYSPQLSHSSIFADENHYRQFLRTIANFSSLSLNNNRDIIPTSFIKSIFPNPYASKRLLEFQFMRILTEGKHFLNCADDIYLIRKIAAKIGLIKGNARSIREHAELNDLILKVFNEIGGNSKHSQADLVSILAHFYKKYKAELLPYARDINTTIDLLNIKLIALEIAQMQIHKQTESSQEKDQDLPSKEENPQHSLSENPSAFSADEPNPTSPKTLPSSPDEQSIPPTLPTQMAVDSTIAEKDLPVQLAPSEKEIPSPSFSVEIERKEPELAPLEEEMTHTSSSIEIEEKEALLTQLTTTESALTLLTAQEILNKLKIEVECKPPTLVWDIDYSFTKLTGKSQFDVVEGTRLEHWIYKTFLKAVKDPSSKPKDEDLFNTKLLVRNLGLNNAFTLLCCGYQLAYELSSAGSSTERQLAKNSLELLKNALEELMATHSIQANAQDLVKLSFHPYLVSKTFINTLFEKEISSTKTSLIKLLALGALMFGAPHLKRFFSPDLLSSEQCGLHEKNSFLQMVPPSNVTLFCPLPEAPIVARVKEPANLNLTDVIMSSFPDISGNTTMNSSAPSSNTTTSNPKPEIWLLPPLPSPKNPPSSDVSLLPEANTAEPSSENNDDVVPAKTSSFIIKVGKGVPIAFTVTASLYVIWNKIWNRQSHGGRQA